jgi:hypothetical protein
MKNLIDIIDTTNEPNILQKIEWGCTRKGSGAKPKYKEENKMKQELLKCIEIIERIEYHESVIRLNLEHINALKGYFPELSNKYAQNVLKREKSIRALEEELKLKLKQLAE